MKKLKQLTLSNFITSTALCTDVAPSAPLSASPGPYILVIAATIMVSMPKPMAPVVVARYPNEIMLENASLP